MTGDVTRPPLLRLLQDPPDASPPRGFDEDWFAAAQPSGFASVLEGAVDVHVHGQPDLATRFENRGSDLAVMRLARQYGIDGWVLKSHLWPTTDRASLLRELAGDGFVVHGSVTLNPVLGGATATTVELAAAHGAKVIFLPTWGAWADVQRDGYIATLLRQVAPSFDRFVAERAVRFVEGNGNLTGTAREVIDACAGLGLSLATGHIGLTESVAVTEYAAGIGYDRVLVTHPLHYVDTPERLRHFAQTGAQIELAVGPLMHPDGHLHIRDVAEVFEVLGPDNLVLSSDAFSRWAPSEPECLRIAVEQLAYLGVPEADLRRTLVDNPRRFLGLDTVLSRKDV